MQRSKKLAAVVGPGALSPAEAVSNVWGYIRRTTCRIRKTAARSWPTKRSATVFGKDKVTMFEMNKHLAAHLK